MLEGKLTPPTLFTALDKRPASKKRGRRGAEKAMPVIEQMALAI